MAAQIQQQELDYKPWGGLAGAISGEQRADRDAANMLALQDSQLGNVIKGVEAGRVTSDFNNPEMEKWRQQGIMGKQQSDYSKGQLDYRNLDSKVQADFAKNMASKSSDQISTAINTLDNFAATVQSNGPAGIQQAMQNLSPEWQQRVQQMEAKNPGSALEFAKSHSSLLKSYLADSADNRGKIKVNAAQEEAKMPGIKEHSASALAVAKEHSRGAMSAASTRAANSKKDVHEAEHKFDLKLMSAHPESRAPYLQGAIATGLHPYSQEPMTPEQTLKYKTVYENDVRVIDAKNSSRQAGKVDVPAVAGIPAVQVPSVGGGGKPPAARPPLSSFNK